MKGIKNKKRNHIYTTIQIEAKNKMLLSFFLFPAIFIRVELTDTLLGAGKYSVAMETRLGDHSIHSNSRMICFLCSPDEHTLSH